MFCESNRNVYREESHLWGWVFRFIEHLFGTHWTVTPSYLYEYIQIKCKAPLPSKHWKSKIEKYKYLEAVILRICFKNMF
jgi:hypothetical protein